MKKVSAVRYVPKIFSYHIWKNGLLEGVGPENRNFFGKAKRVPFGPKKVEICMDHPFPMARVMDLQVHKPRIWYLKNVLYHELRKKNF